MGRALLPLILAASLVGCAAHRVSTPDYTETAIDADPGVLQLGQEHALLLPPLQLQIFGQSEVPPGSLSLTSLNMNAGPIRMDTFSSFDADGNGIITVTGSLATGGDYVQTTNTAELLNNGGSLGVYVNDAEGLCAGNGTGNQSIPSECDGTVTANTFSTVVGTSSNLAFAGGTVCFVTTAVGNVGGGTDDLQTCALAANALTASSRGFRVKAWGTTTNNANAKTVTLNWGSQVIMTQALTTSLAGTWRIDAVIGRTGTSTQDVFAELLQLSTVIDKQTLTAGTQTETGAITIKCTGTATTDNDIVNEGLLVEFL